MAKRDKELKKHSTKILRRICGHVKRYPQRSLRKLSPEVECNLRSLRCPYRDIINSHRKPRLSRWSRSIRLCDSVGHCPSHCDVRNDEMSVMHCLPPGVYSNLVLRDPEADFPIDTELHGLRRYTAVNYQGISMEIAPT